MQDIHNYEHKAFLITLKKTKSSEHVIIALSEVTNIKVEQTLAYKKAYTDELTQIANRHKFNEVLKSEISSPARFSTKLSMFILDIDFFKKFNDDFGHLIGDEVLVELAQLVSSKTRENDTFARRGGEEFIYLMPYTGIQGARKAAENIRKDIENYDFSHGHKIKCSFGCSEYREDDNETDMFKRADKALYEAKEGGRNLVV
jgi:diguanylate cyclase (GGDEF)-like protein